MNYSIIFLDIDNTLYDHQTYSFPVSAINALKKANEQGLKLVLASGRNIDLIAGIGALDLLPLDGLITSNGYVIYDKERKIIFEFEYNPSEVEELIDVCNKHNVVVQYISSTTNHITLPPNQQVKSSCDAFRIPYPIYKKYAGEKVSQLFVFADEKQLKQIQKETKSFSYHRFHEYCVDVFNEQINKGFAVNKYLQQKGIDKAQAIAFGDANNDLEMLNNVGMGIAMGNATTELKQVADYISTAIGDNGIYNALLYLQVVKEDE